MARILIVDDDPDIAEVCRLVLQKEGHKLTSALNVPDGMKAVDDTKPELIILDIMMEQPDDGLVMARQLRRKGIKTPILMLTSLGRITGLEYGADSELVPVDAFEEKPLAPDKLLVRVKELLGKK